MLIEFLLLILGVSLLIKGADWLVNGASALAKKYNVSDLAIGLTVVAFGTSAPELVVNSFASFQGHQDIVFGNIIGSNIFNILVVLGIMGIIAPMAVQSSTVWKEIPFSFLAIVMLFVMGNDFIFSNEHILSRFDGFILLIMFILFMLYEYKQLKKENFADLISEEHLSMLKIVSYITLGLAGLVIGGKLVLDNAVSMATSLGVSEKIIGLTIVAAGTSLPELATSIVALVKKNNDIAVGNIIGSCIFNIFLILGVSSLIRPLVYDIKFNTDIYLLTFGTTILFIAMFVGKKKKLERWEATVLFVSYIIYTIYLINSEI